MYYKRDYHIQYWNINILWIIYIYIYMLYSFARKQYNKPQSFVAYCSIL